MAADVHIWWIGADAPDDALMELIRDRTASAFGVQARLYRHADRPTHAFYPRPRQPAGEKPVRALNAWRNQSSLA